MIWFITENRNEFQNVIKHLSDAGYDAELFSKFSGALSGFTAVVPEAIFIDADMSEVACLEFCWSVKNTQNKKVKLIIFSSSSIEKTEIAAFENGADEFILKPLRERAVIKRILTRLNNYSSSTLSCMIKGIYKLNINRDSFTVLLNNVQIILSRKEFELLALIASEPGKIYSREEIFRRVWKKIMDDKDRTIDVHILRLRKKLGEELISTHKGIGYRLAL
jgi:two-component system alkaline phosphatase synthesis response regulator PhoP